MRASGAMANSEAYKFQCGNISCCFSYDKEFAGQKDSSGKAARYEIPGVRLVNIGPKSEAKHARRLWLLQMSIHVTP